MINLSVSFHVSFSDSAIDSDGGDVVNQVKSENVLKMHKQAFHAV